MAFTDLSDLYGAINEEGINLVVRHLMRLRPSLFNYGTAFIAQNPDLLCHKIDADPMVYKRNNPLLTVEAPLPVLGTNGLVGLNYCVQLVDMKIDFHPGNSITLPPELGQLKKQQFALSAKACVGLGCPDEEILRGLEKVFDRINTPIFVDDYVNTGSLTHVPDRPASSDRQLKPIVLPTRKLTCFCLEVFAVGHIEINQLGNRFIFKPKLDGLEIVDLRPQEMEDAIECYVASVIRLGLLPRLQVALEKIVLDQMSDILTVTLKPTPGLPNNPAIEGDELKAFINMEIS